jgi:hypothetical protein
LLTHAEVAMEGKPDKSQALKVCAATWHDSNTQDKNIFVGIFVGIQ